MYVKRWLLSVISVGVAKCDFLISRTVSIPPISAGEKMQQGIKEKLATNTFTIFDKLVNIGFIA